MRKKDRYRLVLDYFRQAMPIVDTELQYGNVFQLLCAPSLFRRFPDAQSMAGVGEDEVLEYVKSVSYPNSKARHLVAMSQRLVEQFGGEVPQDMDALLTLPGVGRKTANVIQAVAFGQATMAVDTHVFRVSHRLGLVPPSANTPLKVERELVKNIPAGDIPRAHHWLLLHGRYVCKSQRPLCEKCELEHLCPKVQEGSRLEH